MKRILTAVATAALGLGLLTACGDDGGSGAGGDYCDELKAAKKELDSIQGGDFGSLQKTTDRMHDVADAAPDELEDDWKILVEAVDKIVAALKDAGLSDEDMADLQSGQIPDGIDMPALQALQAEIEKLSTDEVEKASNTINKHAKDECGVDLEG